MINSRIVLRRPLVGIPKVDDFEMVTEEIGAPAEGQFLARTLFLSLDPYLRSVMAGRHGPGRVLGEGDLAPGRAVARVIASRHAGFAVGDLVLLETGWQELKLSDGAGVRKLEANVKPHSVHLGVLGMPGLTAWAGVTERLKVATGETFVISAAAGAVGSAAGQWARLAGARVIGIAGGDEKCRYLCEELGFAAAIDYKRADWPAQLAAACPEGIDAYFDNVGPGVLEKVLDLLKPYGRVVLCGLPAQYSSGTPSTVPLTPIIVKRATIMGLVVYDFESRFAEFYAKAKDAFLAGDLRAREDRALGLESAPAAFVKLMNGQNFGKSIVVVAEESS